MGSAEDPTVCSIVDGWLAENGWDGIVCPGECACFVGDLMPCGSEVSADASPCVRVRCGSAQECEGCDDYDSDWAEDGGAGAPWDWCPMAERRRAELLDAIARTSPDAARSAEGGGE